MSVMFDGYFNIRQVRPNFSVILMMIITNLIVNNIKNNTTNFLMFLISKVEGKVLINHFNWFGFLPILFPRALR